MIFGKGLNAGAVVSETEKDRLPVAGRLPMLDGLRGVAALIVAVFHFMIAFMPWMIAGQGERPYWLTDTPLAVFYNGPFAVSVFFVLSGFVIAHAAAKRQSPIWVNLVLRYVRLAIPALASVIFAWVLLSLMPDATMRLNRLLPHDWLQWNYQGNIPGFFYAIYCGAFKIFTGGSNFNNALWTMKFEAIGSAALYMIYGLLAGRARLGCLLLFACLLCPLLKPAYFSFFLGALLRELWVSGRHHPFCPRGLFFVGILLGFPSSGFAGRIGLPALPSLLSWDEKFSLIVPLAAGLMLYGTLYSKIIANALSAPLPQFLGRVSFPLYLIHVPLLYTVFAAIYVDSAPVGVICLCGLFLSFMALAFAIAVMGQCMVDAPALRLVSWLRRRYAAPTASASIKIQ